VSASTKPGDGSAVLVLGEPGGLGAALVRRLGQSGTEVEAAPSLSDSDTSARLSERRWGAVAVVTRDDVLALRLTLLSAHLRPDLPLWVTMFDRTIARELQHVVPAVQVLSPSELVAADLAEQCIAAADAGSRRRSGVRLVDDALRLLVRAGAGVLLALLFEGAISMIALHESAVDALYFSTRTVATVAGTPGAASGPAWFKTLSTLDTLAALLLVAVFTAALVRRLSRPRLTTLFGARAAPARRHVLLVGFGQVGFRLAQELHRRGIAVLGVERDVDAPCVPARTGGGDPGGDRPWRRPRDARTARNPPLRRGRRRDLRRPRQRGRRPGCERPCRGTCHWSCGWAMERSQPRPTRCCISAGYATPTGSPPAGSARPPAARTRR
jgi:voltage-gated potassium channel Kch